MRKTSLALLLTLCAAANARQKTTAITVDAGKFDRHDTVVTFQLPNGLPGKSYSLRDDSRASIPLQIDAAGRATFILPDLKAGKTKEYRLEPSTAGAANQVRASSDERALHIQSNGQPVFDYRLQGELPSADIKPIFKRNGYMHPVFTPAGHIVTDEYPSDHRHQDGIFFAWTKTEFEGRHPDFWNIGDGTGRVELEKLDSTWNGPVHGGFKARLRHMDMSAPKPKPVLNELWEVMVYRPGLFDMVSTQETAGNSPLVLPEYRYGGIGIRGHRDWKAKGSVQFLTSEGKDRIAGDATRARWCAMSGLVDGQPVGIAVLDHPDNCRAPQPLRIHPDDPYFTYSPSKMGPWEITPGKPYISRYRYVVFDGAPNAVELDRLWNDYANPPKVSVTLK
jgi:hypothetical protein